MHNIDVYIYSLNNFEKHTHYTSNNPRNISEMYPKVERCEWHCEDPD